MKTTPKDFQYNGDTVTLEDGFRVVMTTDYDDTADAPWERCDGHGSVSDWTRREKAPGERVICSDHWSKRYYDFAGAIETAKRDGWGLCSKEMSRLIDRLKRAPTRGEVCAEAVEVDFQYLKSWCDDKWHYIGVTVAMFDADENEVASDSIWGVEDNTDYHRELASEMADRLIAAHEMDVRENFDAACRC